MSNNYPSFHEGNTQDYDNYPELTDDLMVKHSKTYEELYEDSSNVDTYKIMRAGFITKVYGILAFQLSITVALISLIFIPQVTNFYQTHLAINIFYVSLVGGIITILILCCVKSMAKKVPFNYILLILFTLFQSYILQFYCTLYEPQSVIIAGILTAAVVITLALYALKTKTDYTNCGAFLFCCITILLIGSIVTIFWNNYFLETVFACIGIVIFSIYLIYDIQLISGKFGQAYDIEDYIMASMNIYLDIINLFITILQILGMKKRK